MDIDAATAKDSLDADIALVMSIGESGKQEGRGSKAKQRKQAAAAAAAAEADGIEEEVPDGKASKGKKRKSTGGNGKQFKICKGCGEKVALEDCAPNFPGDWTCKRALDNIFRLATKQGPKAVEFFKKQREDPEKCKAMVGSYLRACPETLDNAKGARRGVWSIAKYEERCTAASGMVRDKVGELTHKKMYLEFAGSTRGGKTSDEQAEQIWLSWETRVAAKHCSLLRVYAGPAA